MQKILQEHLHHNPIYIEHARKIQSAPCLLRCKRFCIATLTGDKYEEILRFGGSDSQPDNLYLRGLCI
jgi:predicted metal-binding protein